jgi:hypothetical protein
MVSITRVAKTQDTLIEEIEELGGEVTHTDDTWKTYEGDYRPVNWQVNAYFDVPDREYGEIEEACEEIVDSTGWNVHLSWDAANQGVQFERDLRY